jgi:enoyl-CoA hydratase/carnithine racemase
VPELITKKDGAVGWIVFSNPARYNAMTFEMWSGLPTALAAFDADPDVRLVVMTGDGDKAFVSGADISQFEEARSTADAQARYNAAVEAAYLAAPNCSKPVIARIHGICMGGGLGLAASCDLRFGADDAVFRMPAARLGLGYSFHGMRRFVQVLGAANTADIFFSARKFDAQDAYRMGFLDRLVPAADLDRVVDEYAKMVGENAPLSLRTAKAGIRTVIADAPDRDYEALAAMQKACAGSQDYIEGRRAFMEKRTPRFTGS